AMACLILGSPVGCVKRTNPLATAGIGAFHAPYGERLSADPGEVPGVAIGARKEPGGLGIRGDRLAVGIKANRPADALRDVAQVAEQCRAVALLDVAVGPGAALDAGDEVALVLALAPPFGLLGRIDELVALLVDLVAVVAEDHVRL